MTSLDKARKGRSAIRQIQSQCRAGVLTPRELDRLLKVAEEGFDQMMGDEPAPSVPANATRGFAPVVHDGGRA